MRQVASRGPVRDPHCPRNFNSVVTGWFTKKKIRKIKSLWFDPATLEKNISYHGIAQADFLIDEDFNPYGICEAVIHIDEFNDGMKYISFMATSWNNDQDTYMTQHFDQLPTWFITMESLAKTVPEK